ncbi:prephenate dehydrogenase [Scopulibacillus cellulosilyticus]|uniref:Prephenate dehydrogenase n=1 Tax=Scopulibacillus cellulosilyticus TaxID=2665665 RepID=A0ABW2PWH0_9BACL
MVKKKVFIIGLGLIGGSVAQAIRKAHDVQIIGYDSRVESLIEARSLGVIDEYVTELSKGAKDADLIIISVPVNSILEVIEELASLELKRDVLITDTGSTKRKVMEKAQACLSDRYVFIGGHPMAGSHKSGVQASKPDLFENAFYFIVANEKAQPEQVDELKNWLKGTRAKFMTVDPAQHDKSVGLISHFPHIIASGLVHHLKKYSGKGLNLRRLAAGGFRDITRIASSDPIMWQDIISDNRDMMLALFQSWSDEMAKIKEMLLDNDKEKIKAFFADAKTFRDGFPQKEKGAIPGIYDLYVDVADQPGAISDVTRIIGEHSINLININVIEIRENIFGVLRLTFQTSKQRDQAKEILEKNQYKTYLDD